MTKYIFVLATFPYEVFDTQAVLELYRVRWQVEMSFKRMKSLMQAGHVPKCDVSSARAWIQAKILTVLLIEHLQEKASFFPHGAFKSRGRSSWREFLEARDSVLAVLSIPILPSMLVKHGSSLVRLLAERPRKRTIQISRLCESIEFLS